MTRLALAGLVLSFCAVRPAFAADAKLAVNERMLSASSTYASYTPARAFDGDLGQNTGWCAAGGEKRSWLAIDLGGAHRLSRVRVFPDRYDAANSPGDSFLSRFRVEVFADGAWKPASGLVETPAETWYEVAVDVTTQKLRVWAESEGNSPQIKEIELFEAPRSPPGKVQVRESMLSASSTYNGFTPATAFDGNMSQNSGWCAAGGDKRAWLAIDFGREVSLKRVRVFPDRFDAKNNPGDSFLDRFRVEAFNGGKWTPVSALVATPQETWYETAVSVTAQKVRVWAESDGNSPQVKEIELYE